MTLGVVIVAAEAPDPASALSSIAAPPLIVKLSAQIAPDEIDDVELKVAMTDVLAFEGAASSYAM